MDRTHGFQPCNGGFNSPMLRTGPWCSGLSSRSPKPGTLVQIQTDLPTEGSTLASQAVLKTVGGKTSRSSTLLPSANRGVSERLRSLIANQVGSNPLQVQILSPLPKTACSVMESTPDCLSGGGVQIPQAVPLRKGGVVSHWPHKPDRWVRFPLPLPSVLGVNGSIPGFQPGGVSSNLIGRSKNFQGRSM